MQAGKQKLVARVAPMAHCTMILSVASIGRATASWLSLDLGTMGPVVTVASRNFWVKVHAWKGCGLAAIYLLQNYLQSCTSGELILSMKNGMRKGGNGMMQLVVTAF